MFILHSFVIKCFQSESKNTHTIYYFAMAKQQNVRKCMYFNPLAPSLERYAVRCDACAYWPRALAYCTKIFNICPYFSCIYITKILRETDEKGGWEFEDGDSRNHLVLRSACLF